MTPAIRFFEPADTDRIAYTFAIIVSRYKSQWLWVKHRERNTWELPAGHVDGNETPLEAAHRELFEETGALDFEMESKISYEGIYKGNQVFGMIFLADIHELGPMPDFEIGETGLFDDIPDELTYPDIQPAFFRYVNEAKET